MPLEEIYVRYLASHATGRLATIGSDGTPQNKPVGYSYNADLGTIDIGGFNMETSAKYRNIAASPQVSFVVDDDITGEGSSSVRMVEVRGPAEQVTGSPGGHEGRYLIRIHPRRVVSWNVAPGEPAFAAQDLEAGGEPVRGGKYARIERERRFLLAGSPPLPAVSARRRITDRYLPGTRLRLRRVDWDDSGSRPGHAGQDDGQAEFKLTQKLPAGRLGHVRGLITNTYLSATEYELLASLPAGVLTKTRFSNAAARR